jgi:Domain of unknown function (DUF4279)
MNSMNRTVNQGEQKWHRAAFRISGDTLRPDQVSALLGLEPTQSGVKGERFSNRHSVVRRTSFWLLKSPLSESLPLPEHLEWLLNLMEPKLDLIGSLAEKWRVDFFCGFSSENGQGGVTFDPSLLRRLAHLGVPLVLDLYPPEAPLEVDEAFPSANHDDFSPAS